MIECKVLFVDDDELICRVTERGLTSSVTAVTCVGTVEDALRLMATEKFDVVVTDLRLGANGSDPDGLHLLKTVRETYQNVEVILQTGYGTVDNAETALRMGASDFIEKPYKIARLLMVIERTIEHRRLREELSMLRQQVAFDYGYDNMIGEAPKTLRAKESIRLASENSGPVMITGERGTGKNLAAMTIHYHSSRRKAPLFTFDCNVTPTRMIDSELFGAPTGRNASAGLIRRANGGTLVIKNIDALPLESQGKLLDLLDTSGVSHTGGSETIDIRIIGTTTIDMYEMVAGGKFMEGVFERMSRTTISMPTLRDRTDDIQALSESFLHMKTIRNGEAVVSEEYSFTSSALEKLYEHDWPGNVRELKSVVRRSTALARGNEITLDDIFFSSGSIVREGRSTVDSSMTVMDSGSSMEMTYRARILKSLQDNNWNYSQTAQELGIGRTTLWRKVKKYNLSKELIKG